MLIFQEHKSSSQFFSFLELPSHQHLVLPAPRCCSRILSRARRLLCTRSERSVCALKERFVFGADSELPVLPLWLALTGGRRFFCERRKAAPHIGALQALSPLFAKGEEMALHLIDFFNVQAAGRADRRPRPVCVLCVWRALRAAAQPAPLSLSTPPPQQHETQLQ